MEGFLAIGPATKHAPVATGGDRYREHAGRHSLSAPPRPACLTTAEGATATGNTPVAAGSDRYRERAGRRGLAVFDAELAEVRGRPLG